MAEHAHNTSPKSPHATVVTSRRIAVATALLALSGVSAAAAERASPDAELLALCAEFDVLERQYRGIVGACKTVEAEHRSAPLLEPIREQQDALLERICAVPASTRDGMAALAGSLTLWDAEIYFEEDDPHADANERLIAALLRSLLIGRA